MLAMSEVMQSASISGHGSQFFPLLLLLHPQSVLLSQGQGVLLASISGSPLLLFVDFVGGCFHVRRNVRFVILLVLAGGVCIPSSRRAWAWAIPISARTSIRWLWLLGCGWVWPSCTRVPCGSSSRLLWSLLCLGRSCSGASPILSCTIAAVAKWWCWAFPFCFAGCALAGRLHLLALPFGWTLLDAFVLYLSNLSHARLRCLCASHDLGEGALLWNFGCADLRGRGAGWGTGRLRDWSCGGRRATWEGANRPGHRRWCS